MPGLNLRGGAGLNLSGAGPTTDTGTQTVTAAAFSPGMTASTTSAPGAFSLSHPFGISFAVGVGAIVILAIIRHSLPR